jgi:hypothetical protein
VIIDCLRCEGSGRLEVYDRGISVSVMICPDCGGCKVVEVPDDLPTLKAIDCAPETMPEILVGRRA